MVAFIPPYPLCASCKRPMTLTRSEPLTRFANQVCRHFTCECGTTDEDIVAERSTVRVPWAPVMTPRAA